MITLSPGDKVKVPDGRVGTLINFRGDRAAVQFLNADGHTLDIEPFNLKKLVLASADKTP
jgi:hypothetical protein